MPAEFGGRVILTPQPVPHAILANRRVVTAVESRQVAEDGVHEAVEGARLGEAAHGQLVVHHPPAPFEGAAYPRRSRAQRDATIQLLADQRPDLTDQWLEPPCPRVLGQALGKRVEQGPVGDVVLFVRTLALRSI